MTDKNFMRVEDVARELDAKGRFRSIDVSFRVSPEESELLNRFVALSGLTKRNTSQGVF